MRLDFVSPLPPVRSGIADYSLDLLPHLAARPEVAELRVIRLPGQPVADEVAARWRPVPAERLREEAAGEVADEKAADAAPRLPLYQMGNNHHHAAVLELALARPGVLTLHDLFLHHLLAELTLAGDSAEPYVEALERDHGWVGRAVATPRRWGGWTEAGTFALPAHRGLVLRQRGILVHSRWAADFLAEEVPRAEVRTVPMGIPLPPAVGPPGGPEARAARRALGLPEDCPLLGSFGFQTPIKRTVAAVRALARPELAAAHLLVVGEVSPHVDLAGAARSAGVADRVHVTGFVDADTFGRALTACDLALNLRYPTAGETSASLLRLLAAGRGALVSDYAQFRELPAAAVLRVPLGDGEAEALAARAAALLADPRRLRALGEAARDHVALHHAPPAAAAAVAAACAELAEQAPPVAAGEELPPPDVPPPTSATWHRLDGSIRVETGAAEEADGAPWPPGERRRLTLRLANRGPARWLAARRGPGGLAFAVSLRDAAGRELAAGRPWLLLPRDLPPGGELALPFEVRKPPAAARLVIEPVVFDDWGGSRGRRPGPLRWEGELTEPAEAAGLVELAAASEREEAR